MAEICCNVPVSKNDSNSASGPCESSSSRAARRRRMEIRRLRFVSTGVSEEELNGGRKKRVRDCDYTVEKCDKDDNDNGNGREYCHESRVIVKLENGSSSTIRRQSSLTLTLSLPLSLLEQEAILPKFGVASVCGRRRDMEDTVSVYPSFCRQDNGNLHYFAVYDGHGCSHVATRCKERLHELVKDELESNGQEWKSAMERSFTRMDREVKVTNESVAVGTATCRCELQTPECDTVGSTAVVSIVTPDKIIVANCGDSRAVLCRNGKAFPLSSDHKPDRPDELNRIHEAGGRVIYWDGPRVLGVLAMSRAIGDSYLKPYVSCEPEVTITERTAEDDCLILASDGLWDLVSNETACEVARMCLRGKSRLSSPEGDSECRDNGEISDKACVDASMLLTKLALARHSSDNVSVVVVDLRGET